MIFFSSDTHYSHAKVVLYSRRPYKDVEEMNEKLIENWNSKVSNKDIGYLLGDFSFAKPAETVKFIRRLNGAQKHLILGNHDKSMKDWVRDEFDTVQHYLEIKVPDPDVERGQQMIVLCHYPLMSFNKMHHGSWDLHGHCHGTLKDQTGKRLDVGVDVHNYFPISYLEVKEIMKTKVAVATDRHGDRGNDD